MTPIPIYQVVLRLDCGGLEKMVVHLARSLDPARYHVTVCCLEDPGELAVELEGAPVSLISMGKRGLDPGALARLAGRLRRERVRIVHTHNPGAHVYGALAARLAGVPGVVHTRHGPRDEGRQGRLLHRWLWGRVGAAVAVSQDTADVLVHRGRLDPAKVVSIVNGVPVPAFTPEDRRAVRVEFGIPADAPTAGIVARLAPEKDHATLLSALALLRQRRPDLHLLVVGDGALRPALEQQAKALGIATVAHFAGMRRDVHRMLAAMDVFVLSSVFEGTSLTLLEAMGARLPVVATAVGGNPDVIGGPENGILAPPGNAEALAGGMERVLSAPDEAQAMAERAYARMTAVYSLESMTRSYEAVYERVLANRQPIDSSAMSAAPGRVEEASAAP